MSEAGPIDQGVYAAGTPIIEYLTITTRLGDKIDLRPQLVRLVLNEDMLSPYLTGSVLIRDNVGYFDKFGFSGGEKFHVKFYSSTYDPENRLCDCINRTFKILKVTDIQPVNDFTKTYVLHFASPEFLKNETIKISKAYFNKRISEIVMDLMTGDYEPDEGNAQGLAFPRDELTEDIIRSPCATPEALIEVEYAKVDEEDSTELFIEKTSEVTDTVISFPWSKPFDVIRFLSSRAFRNVPGNTDNKSSANFLFFENKRGFQFTSLETLLENKTVSMSTLLYGQPATNMPGTNRAINPNVITDLRVPTAYDLIEAIRGGVFASHLRSYDLMTGQEYVTEFNYSENFYKSDTLEGADRTQNWPQVFLDENNKSDLTEKYNAKQLFMPLNPTREIDLITSTKSARHNDVAQLVGHQEYIQKRLSQLLRMNLWAMQATMPANSKHKVGDIVDLYIGETVYNDPGEKNGADAVSSKPSKYYSGYYLITGITHVVTPTEYQMELELAKDSYRAKLGKQ